jgi:hypothetical protein
MTYHGGCHCGRNRFEVEGDLKQVMDCNCSICTMRGYLHWSVPREKLRLLTPESNLAAYTFKTGTVNHRFCPKCGWRRLSRRPTAFTSTPDASKGSSRQQLRVETFDGRSL